jgi:hypothetical protein
MLGVKVIFGEMAPPQRHVIDSQQAGIAQVKGGERH